LTKPTNNYLHLIRVDVTILTVEEANHFFLLSKLIVVVRHLYRQNIKQERLVCNVQIYVQQSKYYSFPQGSLFALFIQSAGIDLSAE
jgi:hypothetical protein